MIPFYLNDCFLVTKYLAIDNFERYKQEKKNCPYSQHPEMASANKLSIDMFY